VKITKQARREAKQLFLLCQSQGRVDEGRARELLKRMLKEKPRGCLGVLVHFHRLLELDRAEHTARVESAAALTPALSGDVKTRLEQAYGTGLDISFATNPSLIGGMRITVGSDVYDGSVRGRLARLEERF